MLHPVHAPLLCQHQANSAYDKLAVISENIVKLQELEQFIFELKQWLRAYMEGLREDYEGSIQNLLASDNVWTGNNTYTQNISLNGGDIYWKDDQGNVLAWVTYDPVNQLLTFHAGNKEITLSTTGATAPTTNPGVATAIVTLDYLTDALAALRQSIINELSLTFDTTPTDGSTNPVTSDGIYDAIEAARIILDSTVTANSQNGVTSQGIYNFVTNSIAAIEFPETVLPVATKNQKGIMRVGDYLTVENGLVSVDVDAIKSYLGLTSFTEEDVDYVSASFDQLYSGASSGAATPAWSSSSTSVLGNCLGAGNSFLEPHFNIVVQDNGEYSLRKNWGTGTSQNNSAYRDAVDIGVRFYCRNNTTQVTKSYIPLRTVIIYNGIRQSGGGTEAGGIYWQNVQIRAWYKTYDYTLTAEDKNVINTNADAFAASLQLGYDTGTVS